MAGGSGPAIATSRIANVTGGLIVGAGGDPAREALIQRRCEALASVFDEILVARDDGADDPLGLFGDETRMGRSYVEGLVHLLSNARGERVLVVTDDVPEGTEIDVWLALVAWPERDGVVAVTDGGARAGAVRAAIYRREPVLAAARAILESPGADRAALEQRIEAERVDLRALGLSDLLDERLPAEPDERGARARGSTRAKGH